MERIYRGLMWVAGAAVAAGVVQFAWLISNHGQVYSEWQSNTDSGLVFGWLNVGILAILAPGMLLSFIGDLLFGAAVLAIVVAWADHRWRWLVAQVIATAIAFCSTYAMAVVLQSPSFTVVHPRVSAFMQENSLLFQISLFMLPSALAVVMAGRSIKWTALRQHTRALADAELELTRSRL
jgi:hypothetical protein